MQAGKNRCFLCVIQAILFFWKKKKCRNYNVATAHLLPYTWLSFLCKISFMTEIPIMQKPVHCFAEQNQWTGFYMIRTSVMKEL